MRRVFLTFFIQALMVVCVANAQIINAGISGNSTSQLLQRIDKDVISKHPDLAIIMVGTNDMLNSKKMVSLEEYSQNLVEIIKKLKAEGIDVLLMSPPPVDSTYLFMRHDKNLYEQAPNTIMRSLNRKVENIALEQNTFYLDIFHAFSSLGLPEHNEDLFFRNEKNSGVKDGVHPTALGYHFIASNIFQYFKEKKLNVSDKKIICFGDSITYGAGAKGGGTVKGENYPSFLSKMILKNQ